MMIEQARAGDVLDVALRMRDSDFREFSAVSTAETREALAQMLDTAYGARDEVICARGDGPIAIGAMIEARPNVATLLFFATDDFPTIGVGLTRWIKGELFPRSKDAGIHRIECVSIDGHDKAHRWIEALGLEHEAAFRGYGRGGETFHQFAWVGGPGQ